MGYSNRRWTCPFYTWDEKQKIHCEGGCMKFPDQATLRRYADRYCASTTGWRDCTVAAGLLEYYDRKGE